MLLHNAHCIGYAIVYNNYKQFNMSIVLQCYNVLQNYNNIILY